MNHRISSTIRRVTVRMQFVMTQRWYFFFLLIPGLPPLDGTAGPPIPLTRVKEMGFLSYA